MYKKLWDPETHESVLTSFAKRPQSARDGNQQNNYEFGAEKLEEILE